METPHVSTTGAVLFIIISLAYIIIYFIIQFKVFSRLQKHAERFCEEAEKDGRMVIAHCIGSRNASNNGNRSIIRYAGKYTYLAPNGKKYKMRWWDPDCKFSYIPPDTMVLYLEKRNYRKYYTQRSLSRGKHGSIFQILFLIIGFLLYMLLFDKVIMPFLSL